ncbi:MAG: sulfatase [Lewinellaceae bacterium]|nr:sulfatase [Lewinellaceae bacterium]
MIKMAMINLLKILAIGLLLQSCTTEKSPRKPNVLFILVDDLGINDLGFTGSSYYETPHIDRLASQSMIFTQGYAGSRVCSPSRATILTGKFTARHGITDWIGAKSGEDWRALNRYDKLLPADYRHQLSPDEVTLAETMKANGYRTFFAGKWHLGGEGSYPEDHGFDINKGGWEKGSPVGGYFSPFNNPKLNDNYNGENLSMRLARETVEFLKQAGEEPFFAMLSFYAVHGPIQTTQEKWSKYRNKALARGVSEHGFAMERKLPIRQTQDNPVYAGLVKSMDDAVGVVLEELKRQGLKQNTIVIFTSDNGGVASGDSFSTSNLPFRGGKGYQWEGGIRVPYLIYVPWQESKGRQSNYPVTGADFYPTILDYAGIKFLKGQHQDGISLRPVIDESITPGERPLYWHYPHYGNQGGAPSSIIREGRWKLIHYYEEDRTELYDLQKGPFEEKDVAENFPGIAASLSEKLQKWLTEAGAAYPKEDTLFDAAERQDYDSTIVHKLLPKLEAERQRMLSDDFEPNPDWWGSKVTKD